MRFLVIVLLLVAPLVGQSKESKKTAQPFPNQAAEAQFVAEMRVQGERGDAVAQYLLGRHYCEGRGVPLDFTEAVKWFRKAAEQGHAEAQVDLGDRYFLGEGLPKDRTEAVKWYRQAAGQGHARAQGHTAEPCRSGEVVSESCDPGRG